MLWLWTHWSSTQVRLLGLSVIIMIEEWVAEIFFGDHHCGWSKTRVVLIQACVVLCSLIIACCAVVDARGDIRSNSTEHVLSTWLQTCWFERWSFLQRFHRTLLQHGSAVSMCQSLLPFSPIDLGCKQLWKVTVCQRVVNVLDVLFFWIWCSAPDFFPKQSMGF